MAQLQKSKLLRRKQSSFVESRHSHAMEVPIENAAQHSELDLKNAAVIRDPDDTDALDLLGAALERYNRLDEALAIYRYRIGLKPNVSISGRIANLVDSQQLLTPRGHARVMSSTFDPMTSFERSLRKALNDS